MKFTNKPEIDEWYDSSIVGVQKSLDLLVGDRLRRREHVDLPTETGINYSAIVSELGEIKKQTYRRLGIESEPKIVTIAYLCTNLEIHG